MPIDNQPTPGMKPGNYGTQPAVATVPLPLSKPKKDKLKLDKPSKNLKDIIDSIP